MSDKCGLVSTFADAASSSRARVPGTQGLLSEDPAWAPLILKPPQAFRVANLGDSGIEIKILGDTRPIQQWNVMGELRKRLKKAFDQEGIEIPWPHTKVYFGNSPVIINSPVINKDAMK